MVNSFQKFVAASVVAIFAGSVADAQTATIIQKQEAPKTDPKPAPKPEPKKPDPKPVVSKPAPPKPVYTAPKPPEPKPPANVANGGNASATGGTASSQAAAIGQGIATAKTGDVDVGIEIKDGDVVQKVSVAPVIEEGAIKVDGDKIVVEGSEYASTTNVGGDTTNYKAAAQAAPAFGQNNSPCGKVLGLSFGTVDATGSVGIPYESEKCWKNLKEIEGIRYDYAAASDLIASGRDDLVAVGVGALTEINPELKPALAAVVTNLPELPNCATKLKYALSILTDDPSKAPCQATIAPIAPLNYRESEPVQVNVFNTTATPPAAPRVVAKKPIAAQTPTPEEACTAATDAARRVCQPASTPK